MSIAEKAAFAKLTLEFYAKVVQADDEWKTDRGELETLMSDLMVDMHHFANLVSPYVWENVLNKAEFSYAEEVDDEATHEVVDILTSETLFAGEQDECDQWMERHKRWMAKSNAKLRSLIVKKRTDANPPTAT